MTAEDVLRFGWFDGTVAPFGKGHINDTFLVDSFRGKYVLQKINKNVFANPLHVTANHAAIAKFLEGKIAKVATIVKTRTGATAYVDEQSEVWRLQQFVENSGGLQTLMTTAQAYSAGKAFAQFQSSLVDFPQDHLHVTISQFLQLHHYLELFDQQIDKVGFKDSPLLSLVESHRSLATMLPPRTGIIHGDCKIDNLLFDRAGLVCCVLDLDTVMVGHPAWDWGDLARSGAKDSRGQLRFDLIAALAAGFQHATMLSKEELVLAPQYLAFMLGVRFLTDHLQGDVYFKVKAEGDNLVRAREQFELLLWFESQGSELVKL